MRYLSDRFLPLEPARLCTSTCNPCIRCTCKSASPTRSLIFSWSLDCLYAFSPASLNLCLIQTSDKEVELVFWILQLLKWYIHIWIDSLRTCTSIVAKNNCTKFCKQESYLLSSWTISRINLDYAQLPP